MSFYDTGDNGLWIFLLVTVLMGGSAARATGSAIASTWRPPWQIFGAALLLTFAVRFFHYALFYEPLLSLTNFLVDYIVVAARLRARLPDARARARWSSSTPGPTSAPAFSGGAARQEFPPRRGDDFSARFGRTCAPLPAARCALADHLREDPMKQQRLLQHWRSPSPPCSAGCDSGPAKLKIGVAGPMTGSDAAFGAQLKNGVEQAVADINAAGGIKGQQIELFVGDDAGDPRQGVSVANNFLGEGVHFVVGHFNSGVTMPASEVYVENGMLMITPGVHQPA